VTYQLLDVCICIFSFSIADWFIVDGVIDYFVAIQNVNKLYAYYYSYLFWGLGNEEVNCCQVLL